MANEIPFSRDVPEFNQDDAQIYLESFLNDLGRDKYCVDCEGLYVDWAGLQYYAFVVTDQTGTRTGYTVTKTLIYPASDILEYRLILSGAQRIR